MKFLLSPISNGDNNIIVTFLALIGYSFNSRVFKPDSAVATFLTKIIW